MNHQVIETGPVRTVTESVLTFGRSRIVLHTIRYAGWPVLEFRLRIHWGEERRRLKLAVPTNFAPGTVECEVPGGIICRPADGQEHVHGRWFLLEGTAGGRATAVGVVNSGQHGLDLSNGEVRLSVLRSAAYCHERNFPLGDRPARRYMEQGEHDVRLLVTAGNPKAVRDRLPGLADWLDAPPVVYAHLPIGSSSVSTKLELLSLSPRTVRLTACKPSHDGYALVVRIQEATGRATRASLRLAKPPVSIDRPLRPLEIVTFRIERDGSWREADPIDET